MKTKLVKLLFVTGIALMLVACKSNAKDVATLHTEATQPVEATPLAPLDNEIMMMAFTECLREHGIEAVDPVVDAEDNIQKPELVAGTQWDKETMGEAWEACAEQLEGFTFKKERVDTSEIVDQYMELAACRRDKGYNINDPTAETLDT